MPIKNAIIFKDLENFEDGLAKALRMPSQDVVMEVRESGLKGRGGAGFPTGTKWMLCATAVAPQKYVVCNADEGEPGTFKDRILLDEYTKYVLEGMVLAGYAIGANKGYLYLRGEYSYLKKKIESYLEKMKQLNRLGTNILGSNFCYDIEIRLGAGAYVCGEESALLESMEGHRGEPRNRPPFPVTTGYNHSPTIINNVETFASVYFILAKGAEWYKKFGTQKSIGTKLLSVSGDCSSPGIYEITFGTTVYELLAMVGAKDVKAVQIGGASGICIPKSEFNRGISFEDIPTGGSIIIFNEKRDMLHILKNFMDFFVEESCGQCVPCRIGNMKLLEGIEKIEHGTCSVNYLNELIDLGKSMQVASKCGLGQSSPNPFISIMQHFGDEILSR